jgi:uncharacterized protein (TIGR03000 family)
MRTPLNSAPNTWFPSKTIGFSTGPLFPYASATFPYGYGFAAREVPEESPRRPVVPPRETEPDPNAATVIVHVPAGAEIWFEGAKTGQRGATRTFVSPPLAPGKGFTYDLRARWKEDGKEIDRNRAVRVHAGETVEVTFGEKK